MQVQRSIHKEYVELFTIQHIILKEYVVLYASI